MISNDTHNGTVYHVADPDLFLTIAYGRTPKQGDWIVVDRNIGAGLAVEPYNGQADYYGVVNVLDFVQLPGGSLQTKIEPQKPRQLAC